MEEASNFTTPDSLIHKIIVLIKKMLSKARYVEIVGKGRMRSLGFNGSGNKVRTF